MKVETALFFVISGSIVKGVGVIILASLKGVGCQKVTCQSLNQRYVLFGILSLNSQFYSATYIIASMVLLICI